MHTPQFMAALAALASIVTATPIQGADGLAGFTVTQVKGGHKFKNGAVAVEQAFRKYKASPPEDVSNAAKTALTQQGTVTATPEQYDSEYLCPVTVGQNQLMLDFDSGSSDLWVFSTEQPTSQSSGHTLYTCTGTLKSGYTWSITYGDGSGASGNVFSDTVVVGSVTATSQAVEAATSVSSTFVSDTANDGLLGLAFNSINQVKPVQQATFFSNVQPSLPSPIFTADLKYHAAGSYDFGFINPSKYVGSIAYAPVSTSNGFWQFNIGGYSVGSGAEVTGTLSCIADTGTSIILIANSVVKAYWSKVSGAGYSSQEGGYIFPCTATLPSFSVYINGQQRTVPGTYINYAPVSSYYCYGGIQSSAGIGFNILGDIFLKSQFVIFDASVPQIGVAAQ